MQWNHVNVSLHRNWVIKKGTSIYLRRLPVETDLYFFDLHALFFNHDLKINVARVHMHTILFVKETSYLLVSQNNLTFLMISRSRKGFTIWSGGIVCDIQVHIYNKINDTRRSILPHWFEYTESQPHLFCYLKVLPGTNHKEW